MKKFDVVIALEGLREAKDKWRMAQLEFNSGFDSVLLRLIHEGVSNFMSAEEIAAAVGLTPKRIRQIMSSRGMNPKSGKRLLSKQAAEALANNSALLGIAPADMDLMSPLAYLPMGSEMKRALQDKQVSQVTELDEPVSGNLLTDADWREYQSIPEQGYSHRDWLEQRFALRHSERAAQLR